MIIHYGEAYGDKNDIEKKNFGLFKHEPMLPWNIPQANPICEKVEIPVDDESIIRSFETIELHDDKIQQKCHIFDGL